MRRNNARKKQAYEDRQKKNAENRRTVWEYVSTHRDASKHTIGFETRIPNDELKNILGTLSRRGLIRFENGSWIANPTEAKVADDFNFWKHYQNRRAGNAVPKLPPAPKPKIEAPKKPRATKPHAGIKVGVPFVDPEHDEWMKGVLEEQERKAAIKKAMSRW